ncbi:DUF2735 domain-containing protein [Rhizobium jaguaris]|uniref:DUF2735 domain-containing protein n=1 Tax=Rhizobium jaguaris TaxID=1312183 RepID=UPI0039BF61A6
MTIGSHRETAKIYQFPVTARPIPAGRREKVNLTPDIGPTICTAAFDSWYHEAAIAESDQTRKQ